MLGHIRNAQNELIFDLGQQIKMMRPHHLFRQVGHRIPFFAVVVLVVAVALFSNGIPIVEVVFGFDQLQQDFAVDRIRKRRIAPLADHDRIRPHMQMQKRLAHQEANLAFFAAHGPGHKTGLARRLFRQAFDRARKPHQGNNALRLLAQAGKCEGIDALNICTGSAARHCSPGSRGFTRGSALRSSTHLCTCRSARTAASAARQSLRCHVDVPAKMPQNVR
ncbi:hypothetical protein D3C72_1390190 [compost metagenome]